MEKNLTNGSVFKNVLLFSLPYLLSYFLQTLYGMADLFIIGQFEGVAATTAVSVGSQVMHMLTVMIVGLAMGTTVSIAQAVGSGDRNSASRNVGNTVTLFMAVSVVMTVVLLLSVRAIVAAMSTPAEAADGTAAYLTICFVGIPFITAYNIISSIFRGMGDSKSPMYFIAVACAANIILDYFFYGRAASGPCRRGDEHSGQHKKYYFHKNGGKGEGHKDFKSGFQCGVYNFLPCNMGRRKKYSGRNCESYFDIRLRQQQYGFCENYDIFYKHRLAHI